MPLLRFSPSLRLERVVDVPRELVWAAWTKPEHIKKWFTPAPWKTVDCEIDLRPGGKFSTVMESPEGQRMPNTGCYLEIVENEKLVFTGALAPGYRAEGGGGRSVFVHGGDSARGGGELVDEIHGDRDSCRCGWVQEA